MKKRRILVLNSPYLGGAERSGIVQAALLQKEFDIFIPELIRGDGKEIINLINSEFKTDVCIKRFIYPNALFSISRETPIFKMIISVFQSIFQIFDLSNEINLNHQTTIWVNGNKAGFLFFILALKNKFKGTFYWHFRDYPSQRPIWSCIWRLLGLKRCFDLVLIGNSKSVSKSLHQLKIHNSSVQTIYNPSGLAENKKFSKGIRTIGLASMFAPWKGIHSILLWVGLYEKELQEIGIEKINIYGGQIYQTSGGHAQYDKALIDLVEKFNINIVEFKGLKAPSIIFDEIDLLIHYSLRPEPFGRILLEAFSRGIPTISTSLGGANELVEKAHALKVIPYDYAGLFHTIKKLTIEFPSTATLISENELKAFRYFEDLAEKQLKRCFVD